MENVFTNSIQLLFWYIFRSEWYIQRAHNARNWNKDLNLADGKVSHSFSVFHKQPSPYATHNAICEANFSHKVYKLLSASNRGYRAFIGSVNNNAINHDFILFHPNSNFSSQMENGFVGKSFRWWFIYSIWNSFTQHITTHRRY